MKLLINEALRLMRVSHDVKQMDLAAKLGLSKSYISEIESGKTTPSLDVIQKYSAAFDVPVSSILFFSETLGKGGLKEQLRKIVAPKMLGLAQVIERLGKLQVEEYENYEPTTPTKIIKNKQADTLDKK